MSVAERLWYGCVTITRPGVCSTLSMLVHLSLVVKPVLVKAGGFSEEEWPSSRSHFLKS